MSVQPVDHHDSGDPHTPDVPPTIEAISGALGSQELRLQFYTETLSAPAGAQISEVLERWRAEAMLDASGNRERRPSARRTGFDELTAPLGGVDAL
ncbi:hypothetical protein [Streptacidiphilus jiangxiensis]|uniref:Uncharacterized protein n=1 Tax=Streptacidiphilus jiangxiensis TaxID=235985 RepID=A0A1H8A1U5_STRJI|nr:hypothetical protein [Streptacidiphilus jiangxiensis]SEM63884.1 hypothetical protein SAMN05414137_13944 [Streptacidiphilus jiangxiensis]